MRTMASSFSLCVLLVTLVKFSECACPNGWIRHGQMCYHFSTELEDWTGAKVMCETIKGQLVEIETSEENHFLGQQAKIYNKNYWIALSDVIEEDTWVWMISQRTASFTNWNNNEPNNGGTENCVDLYPGGHWNDAKCRDYQFYICEKPDECLDIADSCTWGLIGTYQNGTTFCPLCPSYKTSNGSKDIVLLRLNPTPYNCSGVPFNQEEVITCSPK